MEQPQAQENPLPVPLARWILGGAGDCRGLTAAQEGARLRATAECCGEEVPEGEQQQGSVSPPAVSDQLASTLVAKPAS